MLEVQLTSTLVHMLTTSIKTHVQGYFERPAFVNYLAYLRYWKRPEYAKHITYVASSLRILSSCPTHGFLPADVNAAMDHEQLASLCQRGNVHAPLCLFCVSHQVPTRTGASRSSSERKFQVSVGAIVTCYAAAAVRIHLSPTSGLRARVVADSCHIFVLSFEFNSCAM